jgi:hypothetical protein
VFVGVHGFKVAFWLECIKDAYLREKISFVRANLKFGAKLAITDIVSTSKLFNEDFGSLKPSLSLT